MELGRLEYVSILGIITGFAMGFLVHYMRRRNTEEPENDERTEKVAGKAAQNTIIVEMLVMAVILFGDISGLLMLGTTVSVSVLFFALLLSLIVFRYYYRARQI